ncbi:unnamed protein product [Penicillium salamii]|nr:unnamed protein product [Penicillium salamii]
MSCFLIYLAVIGHLFGEKHPKALSMENNLVIAPFRKKYLRHNLTLPANLSAKPSARLRQIRSTRSSNNETEVCDKFNIIGCLWEGCKRRHKYTACGLSQHSASSCRKKT